MDNGAVGGGGPVLFDQIVPLYIQVIIHFAAVGAKLIGFTGGAFMFCTRAAFHATGGFDERFFWAEEGVFALALKRHGRFIVLWNSVLTSPRRLRTLSGRQFPVFIARLIFSPFKTFTRRASVENIWYDSNRSGDYKIANSPAAKVSNGIALLIVIVLFTGPLWNFIPQSLTPWDSPQGKVRLAIGIFLCHVGLIFWPIAIVVFVHLFRQRQWVEWTKLAALAAFCFWLAWGATHGVIWSWTRLCHMLG